MGWLTRLLGTRPSPPLEPALFNPFKGKRLSYLIGANRLAPRSGVDPRIVEVGYDAEGGGDIAYCNLFNEKYAEQNTQERSKYGPYLKASDTAQEYNEGQIDPAGAGWLRNLDEQFTRRRAQGFKYIELDNCDAYDAYSSAIVLDVYDRAAERGFYVIAKNPGICKDDWAMVRHPAVVGIIVEKDCGTPQQMSELRVHARKPDLPVWFVCFDKTYAAGPGWKWGHATFGAIMNYSNNASYSNMYVTWSRGGEYVNAIDF